MPHTDPTKPKTFKQACVMGWPIAHSLSPKLHGYWLDKYSIEGGYHAEAVPAVKLRDALQALIDEGYAGCNLTIPHKEEALALMDSHDDSALVAGAVNTVVVQGGKLVGYDSDGFGFIENLKAQYPAWKGDRVAVIGTGGAARSIIATLKQYGAKQFALVNRTEDRAHKIADAFCLDAEIYSWEHRHDALKDATLLINSSCLGMIGQDALDLKLDNLPPEAAVCDIVYRPLKTQLVLDAKERGNPVVKGLGMLLHQGRLGFRLWFGTDPEVTPELYDNMKKLAA
jgi:shikimate dehydrogenase